MTSCSLDFSAQQRSHQDNPTVKSPQGTLKYTFTPIGEHTVEREFFIRCIVFGAEKCGKHSLIMSNFQREKDPVQTYARNDVDFIAKTHKVPYNKKKYHFWSFRLSDKSLRKEVLWRTYYKSASAFIFVYDVTNLESFKRLEQLVQTVLKSVSESEFYGILVGTKSDLGHQREVSYDQAASFKLKYGFAQFIETGQSHKQGENTQLIDLLEPRLKLTFESI